MKGQGPFNFHRGKKFAILEEMACALFYSSLITLISLLFCFVNPQPAEDSFYSLSAVDIHGNAVKFDKFKNQVSRYGILYTLASN